MSEGQAQIVEHYAKQCRLRSRAGLKMSSRALDFGARLRALVERGGRPSYRANALIHGDIAATTLANVARAYKDGSLVAIEVVARKR